MAIIVTCTTPFAWKAVGSPGCTGMAHSSIIRPLSNVRLLRRWSGRRFPYGHLVTTSPPSPNPDST